MGALLSSIAACDWDRGRTSSEPPRVEQSTAPLEGTAQQNPATTAPAISGKQAPEASANARPSADENMGRAFQGSMQVRLKMPDGERLITYLARGNRARIQVDGGNRRLDALIWDENITLIDNEQKTYRTLALDDVKPAPASPGDVSAKATGERAMVQGNMCERYALNDATTRVSACVTGVPGAFSMPKFEAVTGYDIPAWAEYLFEKNMMPLQATAEDAQGRPLYSLDVTQYTGGPIDESLVALPSNYREEAGSTTARRP